MIQTLEDIIRIFCAYGMEYKDHEGYTHGWVTLIPAFQLPACDSKPEHKNESQIPYINVIGKIPLKHGAETNHPKRYQRKDKTHHFPDTQVPSS
ncbi:hypothetical protein O181_048928 [Austropuccinia psidii MF-1]|uniref:Uncharacterized protein n=1 Tax=Austropuccinia psidii MF-1 TaxID=1389203 RepID=A0A9Q3HKX7_9BASI|nr:hypothetical protein [Austropuccinia psidii MF-1]